MKWISRSIGGAVLATACAASNAALMMSIPRLTGTVEIAGFSDGSPTTYTVTYRDLVGAVTLNKLPAGDYRVSVQGYGSFDLDEDGSPDVEAQLTQPFAVYTGFLSNGGLQRPSYTFTFTNAVDGQNDLFVGDIAFSTRYDGRLADPVFDLINGVAGNRFSEATGAGTLDVTGAIFSDGAVFHVSETANWFQNLGFGGLLLAADRSGLQDGRIDGNFVLRDVQVSAVPAPATLALVGLGLLGLAATRRRV